MKKLMFLSLAILFLLGCDKEDSTIELPVISCEEDCLFAVNSGPGKMIFMSCFERWAIETKHPEDAELTIYGILPDIEQQFQVDKKSVVFTASYRSNSLVPIFPDPSFNMSSLYEIDLVGIK